MEKEILEGNKLIAAFMDEVYKTQMGNIVNFINKPTPFETSNSFEVGELQYHTSWDWLMPVVDKIMDINITPAPQWTGYRMEIVPRGYVKISGFPMNTINTNVSIEGSLIKAVWKAVVEFIELYNSNKKL